MDTHNIDLDAVLNREHPPTSFGSFEDSNLSSSSTQRSQRLPSPSNCSSSSDEPDKDVEHIIDSIIAGFNKFLSIIGRE